MIPFFPSFSLNLLGPFFFLFFDRLFLPLAEVSFLIPAVGHSIQEVHNPKGANFFPMFLVIFPGNLFFSARAFRIDFLCFFPGPLILPGLLRRVSLLALQCFLHPFQKNPECFVVFFPLYVGESTNRFVRLPLAIFLRCGKKTAFFPFSVARTTFPKPLLLQMFVPNSLTFTCSLCPYPKGFHFCPSPPLSISLSQWRLFFIDTRQFLLSLETIKLRPSLRFPALPFIFHSSFSCCLNASSFFSILLCWGILSPFSSVIEDVSFVRPPTGPTVSYFCVF